MKLSKIKGHSIDWFNKVLKSLKDTSAPIIAAAIIAGFSTFNLTDIRLVQPNNTRIDGLSKRIELLENRLAKVEAEKLQITVSPDGKSYILKEEFDGTEARWVKDASYKNVFDSGYYYINNSSDGYAYSTVPISHPMLEYDLVLESKWVDGRKDAFFGILLYGDSNNIIRFNLARNSSASVQRKSNGSAYTELVELDVDLGEESIKATQIIRYTDGVISYFAGNRLIGKFNFRDFPINRVGVFVQGELNIGFNKLHITEG
ncbi:MAG: hypothetical protein ACI9WS_000332 [Paraglaciecola psychrophila]|jgi:hypothetical protein